MLTTISNLSTKKQPKQKNTLILTTSIYANKSLKVYYNI